MAKQLKGEERLADWKTQMQVLCQCLWGAPCLTWPSSASLVKLLYF